jgi:putative transposase
MLNEVSDDYGFALVGYVVMPEHVHLLISEPERGTASMVIQVLKQRISCALRKERGEAKGSAVWQRRFYDFNVWSAKKVPEKLRYMHENPVKRKLVSGAGDWKWSSWLNYANGEPGLIRIDGGR